MQKTLFILFLSACTTLFAQVTFQKGYFIKNNGEKSEVLIKNEDWMYNPEMFTYKMSESSHQATGKISDIKEFGVYDFSKYVRFTGNIDSSTDNLQKLTFESTPNWIEKTVFLKVLSDGTKNLYMYNDKDMQRFFYSDETTPITQLIYKRYFPDGDPNGFATNNQYKNQLHSYFSNTGSTVNTDNLDYKQQSLMKFFENQNGTNANIKSGAENSKINLYIRPGIAISTASLDFGSNSNPNTEFESKISPRIGIELEYIFPFNRNKWAVVVEPTYQTYKQTGNTASGEDASISYSTIELAAGIRHYMYLNAESKLFIDGIVNAAHFHFGDNSVSYFVTGTDFAKNFELESSPNFAFGFGYMYKDKYVIQARQYTRKSITKMPFMQSDYTNFSLIFGYNIF